MSSSENELVKQLLESFNSLVESVKGLTTSVNGLQVDVSRLQDENSDLRAELTTHQQNSGMMFPQWKRLPLELRR